MFTIDIVKQLNGTLQIMQQSTVESECKSKLKLRTFVKFKDFKAASSSALLAQNNVKQ